jgi:hypothetical protein
MVRMTGTGLFLGAGASFESGMPLVWDLSAEIRAWLTPDKLRELNKGWRAQGSGNPDEVIDALVVSLLDGSMHYENILGNLEVQFNRPFTASTGHVRQAYHGLYSWLVELVYHLLWFRHVQNESFIKRSLRYLEGIAGLARQSAPLWIFSLNHDSIIECLAAHYDVRLDCGFSGTGRLPLRDPAGIKVGELPINTLAVDRLEKSGFDFRNLNEPGINLIKIHDALDVFTANDSRDLIKLAPVGDGVGGVLESLRAANEKLVYVVPGYPGKVKALNEITYADETGEMQFLRKTILSGAYKFDRRKTQVLPPSILNQFRIFLNRVSRLVCIGYGCGDTHINQVLREWLEFSGDRKLELVGPGTKTCPPFAGHVASQVILKDEFATDYLEQYALMPLSMSERLFKAGLRRARVCRRKKMGFA